MPDEKDLLFGFKEVEMKDVEFAKLLKKNGWKGDYLPVGIFQRFVRGKDTLAIVRYKNDPPVNRWIYINTKLMKVKNG